MGKFQPKVPKGSISRYERDLKPGKYKESGRKPKLRSPQYAMQPYQQKSLDAAWEQLMSDLPEWTGMEFGTDTGRYRKVGEKPADLGLPPLISAYDIGAVFEIYGKKYRVVSITQDSVQMEPYVDGPSQEEQDALAALHLA